VPSPSSGDADQTKAMALKLISKTKTAPASKVRDYDCSWACRHRRFRVNTSASARRL